jgi:hypothetical protein
LFAIDQKANKGSPFQHVKSLNRDSRNDRKNCYYQGTHKNPLPRSQQMPNPESPKPFYMKDMVDREIDRFAVQENPTQGDLNRVDVAAQVQYGLDRYRAQALNMTFDDFITEKHRSGRLAKMMARAGEARPSNRCDAHAIVSGGHRFSAVSRAVMAWCGMRIDDPYNGCWLPRCEEDKPHMPPHLRKAVTHNRIHREAYYDWLRMLINRTSIKSIDDLIRVLGMVKMRLQSSALPPRVIPPERKA